MSISTNQIGELIKVETTYDEQIIGEIYCYDRSTSLLVLNILRVVNELPLSFTNTTEDSEYGRFRYCNAEAGIH